MAGRNRRLRPGSWFRAGCPEWTEFEVTVVRRLGIASALKEKTVRLEHLPSGIVATASAIGKERRIINDLTQALLNALAEQGNGAPAASRYYARMKRHLEERQEGKLAAIYLGRMHATLGEIITAQRVAAPCEDRR